jgi:hypothetical protein
MKIKIYNLGFLFVLYLLTYILSYIKKTYPISALHIECVVIGFSIYDLIVPSLANSSTTAAYLTTSPSFFSGGPGLFLS